MVAAGLPLPPDPQKSSAHASQRTSDQTGEFGVPEGFKRQLVLADEVRFQNARWWRNLNRGMAVVGLLLLGAVAALVVIGVRDGWGQGSPGQ